MRLTNSEYIGSLGVRRSRKISSSYYFRLSDSRSSCSNVC